MNWNSPLLVDLLALSSAVFLVGTACIAPQESRSGFYFGVRVDPEFKSTTEAKRVLRDYRLQAAMHALISFALLIAGFRWNSMLLWSLAIMWSQVGIQRALSAARKKIQPYAVAPPTTREAELTTRQTGLPGGWFLQLVPFLVLLGTAIFLHLNWRRIPIRFPSSWYRNGQPFEWSVRTPLRIYGPLLLGAVFIAAMSLGSYAPLLFPSRARIGKGGRGIYDAMRRVVIETVVSELFLAAGFSVVALQPLTGRAPWVVVMLAMLIFYAVLFFMLIRFRRMRSEEIAPGGTELDENWIGSWYVNPDDEALFVDSRDGSGYAVNLGQPASCLWMALAALIAVGFMVAILYYSW
jgi:uncharacterized membrane protein